jgi:sodium-dependent dicarboxylate transporter 2/3/5
MTAIASAFGFLTVAAAPACTIIYASGLLKGRDFLRVGWKIGLLTLLLTLIYVNTYWRLLPW